MTRDEELQRSWQARFLKVAILFFLIGFGLFIAKLFGFVNYSFTYHTFPDHIKDYAGFICVFLLWILSLKFRALKRRYVAKDAQRIMQEDTRPPILYLRSFKDDIDVSKSIKNYTIEEELAIVLNEIGPVITVGKPGEKLPLPGAARTYLKKNKWQKKVTDLMLKSKLVVLQIGETDGIWWEMHTAFSKVKPEKLLIVAVNKKHSKIFCEKILEYFNRRLFPPNSRNGWMLYFESDWTPRFIKMPHRFTYSFRYNREHPMVIPLKKALRDIFTRFNVTWKLPPILWIQLLLTAISFIIGSIYVYIH